MSADVALDWIRRRTIPAKDVLVIQESDRPSGRSLCDLGANAGVLVWGLNRPCSPQSSTTSSFELRAKFKHSVLYRGALAANQENDHVLHFPIFKKEELLDPVPWIQRQGKICMVAALKHYAFMPPQPDSPSYQRALSQQLHDFRLMAIEYFLNKGELDLHGPGWKNSSVLWRAFCNS